MQTGPRRLNMSSSPTRSGKLSKRNYLSKGIGSPKRRKYDLRDIVNVLQGKVAGLQVDYFYMQEQQQQKKTIDIAFEKIKVESEGNVKFKIK